MGGDPTPFVMREPSGGVREGQVVAACTTRVQGCRTGDPTTSVVFAQRMRLLTAKMPVGTLMFGCREQHHRDVVNV